MSENREKISLAAQTTYNYAKFRQLVEIFKEKVYDVSIKNTICNATKERQQEAEEIASVADVMIVIGGENSSNTKKLYEICKNKCEDTF